MPWDLYNKYFLSEKTTNDFDLEWRWNPIHTYNKVSNYKPTKYDVIHYSFLSLVNLFVFVMLPVHFLWKFLLFALYFTLITVPITSQLFFNAYPILTWVFLFFSSSKIPVSWRPPISVKVLPATETIFYGDNLSNILAASTNSFLDMMAWLPYGIIHFSFPFVLAAFIWVFGPPTSLQSYAKAFGYMNLIGVIIQNCFPSAPPWYKLLHGLNPADYSMKGSPGGLGRIDVLFGFDMYTTTFENSPVIFGAFPSLHSGSATMEALFLTWLFPKGVVFWWIYVSWLWWCTMYLTHHYFIDLTAGACLSVIVFTIVRYTSLPVNEKNKFCRFSYSKLEYQTFSDVENYSSSHYVEDEEYQLSMLPPLANPLPNSPSMGSQQQQEQQHQQQQQQQKTDAAIRSRNSPPTLSINTIDDENHSSNSSIFDIDINNSSATSLSSMSAGNYTSSLSKH